MKLQILHEVLDQSDYISDAAARFNVSYQDVAKGMR